MKIVTLVCIQYLSISHAGTLDLVFGEVDR